MKIPPVKIHRILFEILLVGPLEFDCLTTIAIPHHHIAG